MQTLVRNLKICLVCCFPVLLTGCFQSDSTNEARLEYRAALKPFASCDALSTYLQETAEQQHRLENYYFTLPGIMVDQVDSGGAQNDTVSSPAAPAPGTESTASISEYSATNNQVSGVDEADFVKTEGEYTYIVSGGYLVILDSWPAAQSHELTRVKVHGNPSNLFVYEDTLWIVSDLYQSDPLDSLVGFAPRVNQLTLISVFDISDRSQPKLLRETTLEGYYVDARRIANRVLLVTSAYFDLYPLLKTGVTPALQAMLPLLTDKVYSDTGPVISEQQVSSCEHIYQPESANGTGAITLSSFDLLLPRAEIGRQTIISNSGMVYANRDHLYLATVEDNFWSWSPVLEGSDTSPRPGTTFHKFSLQEEPVYLASGRVDGYLINQFAMDEDEGLLRSVTSSFAWWNDSAPVNSLFILEQEGEQLIERSRLSGLGKPGERIYAARFIKDKGFVVTFQQIDPLYTLDLSDPDMPRIAGELEVPGFSTYLHPLQDDLLLAIGRSAGNDSTDLSLFDTSNFDDPRLLHRISIGKDSYSEAEYNHKAFTWYPAEQVLSIPISRWSGHLTDGYQSYRAFNGLQLFRVATDSGFTDIGEIDHSHFYQNPEQQYWYQPENIRRSFFVTDDQQQSYLYSISSRGLKVNALSDPGTDLVKLELPVYDWQDTVLFY